MQRRHFLGAVGALALTTALPLAALAETPPNQLIVGFSMANVLTLDPGGTGSKEKIQINANVYESLVGMDPENRSEPVPELAESWEISPDGRAIRFTLRPDLTFASGNPLTAEDVVWSIIRVMQIELAQATHYKLRGYTLENVSENVLAIDPRTVEIRLPEATDPKIILLTLALAGPGSVLDRKLVLEHEVNGDLGQAWLATNTAGSGPYAVQRMLPNELVILQRNENYWGEAGLMDRILMRHLPESQTQRLLLGQGDLDIAFSLSAADLAAAESDPNLTVTSAIGNGLYYLASSLKDPVTGDARVREAIFKLIDFDGINDAVMRFYGVKHLQPVQIGLGGEAAPDTPTRDVEGAKALLAEAGYPNGLTLSLRALAEPPFDNLAVAIQGNLAEGGIKAEIITGGGETVYGAMRQREFQLIVGRSGGQVQHPDGDLRSLLYNLDNSDEAKLVGLLAWRVSYFDPEMNRRMQEALLLPPAEQAAAYAEIQSLYAASHPAIQPISQVTDSVATRSDITGLRISPVWQTKLAVVGKAR